MDQLAIQFACPGHSAAAVRAAQMETVPMYSAYLLLYAAHGLLRTACESSGDFDSSGPDAGRFSALVKHLLTFDESIRDSTGTPVSRHIATAICSDGVRESLKAMQKIADDMLALDIPGSRPADEWQPLVKTLTETLETLLPLANAIRPAAIDEKGNAHVYAGPGGCAVCHPTGAVAGQTVLMLPGGAFSVLGPSYRDEGQPEPLIAFNGIQDTFETISGFIVDHAGRIAVPLGRLNGQAAMARLMAWHLDECWETADKLRSSVSGDTGVEYLLFKSAGQTDWNSLDGIQKLLEFVSANAGDDLLARFHEFAPSKISVLENRAIQNNDFQGLAETLILEQHFQDGQQKAATLNRLATVYNEKLDDRAAALLCLIRALDAAPSETRVIDDLIWLTEELAKDGISQSVSEMATELLEAARKIRGTEGESRVLGAAAELLERAGNAAEAVQAHRRLLELNPNRHESFDFVVSGLSDDAEIEKECRALLKAAWVPESRGKYLMRLASALPGQGKAEEAGAAVNEALTLLPTTTELLDDARTFLEAAGDWPGLIEVTRKRAGLSDDPDAPRIAALVMADIALEKMDAPVMALATLKKANASKDPEIRRRMYSIHAGLDMWKAAAEDLEILVETDGSPEDRATLARIYRDRLGKPGQAATAFRKALERMDGPSLVETALEFAELPGLLDEDGFVSSILNKALDATDDDIVKADLFKKLGNFDKSVSGSVEASVKALEKALKLNPLDIGLAIKLADTYLSRDQAEKALSILEAPARAAAEKGDSDTEIRLRNIAATAATRCFDHKGAARHLRRILEINPDDGDTTRRLARAETALGNIDAAVELLESISLARGTASKNDAPMLRDLGRALSAKGEHKGALKRLEEAWTLDQSQAEDTLRELADAASSAEDRPAMISWLKKLVGVEEKSPRRFTDLLRLGDAVRAGGDPEGAVEWYMSASREDYSKKVALHKALEASMEAGNYSKAKNLLMSITEEEQDDLKKSDYLLAAALLARDHLDDDEQAAAMLKESLAKNPYNEPAAEALDAILIKHSRLEELAETLALRARHYRVAGDNEILLETLRSLADVYESKLHNSVKAAEILRQILTAAPDDQAATKHLAYCLTRIPGSEVEALEVLRSVVTGDPTSIDSYRAIRDLSILTSDEDMATRASSALIVLGQADESDFHMAARNRAAALRLKRDQIPPDAFMRYMARNLDTQVARIFALIYQPILKIVPFKTPESLGLKPSNKLAMDEDGLFQNMADAVARVFDLDLPIFWHVPGSKGIRKAPFAQKAVLVGDDLVSTRRGKDLRFSLARAVVSFMPGFELCGIMDSASMRLFFLAALKMSFPDYPLPSDATGARDFVSPLTVHVKEQDLQEIHRIMSNFRKMQRPVDLPAYTRSVDLIAARAGLFMSNDLEVASSRTLEADMTLSEMEPEDRLVELCSWCVSADFSELKKLMIQT